MSMRLCAASYATDPSRTAYVQVSTPVNSCAVSVIRDVPPGRRTLPSCLSQGRVLAHSALPLSAAHLLR